MSSLSDHWTRKQSKTSLAPGFGTNTDWESKFLPGLGMASATACTTSLAPWWFNSVGCI